MMATLPPLAMSVCMYFFGSAASQLGSTHAPHELDSQRRRAMQPSKLVQSQMEAGQTCCLSSA